MTTAGRWTVVRLMLEKKSQNPADCHSDSDWTFLLNSVTFPAMILDRVSSAASGHPQLSGFILALANMIPVIGVIIWEWNLFDIMALYWSECLMIGILNIFRMALAREGNLAAKPVLIACFLLHFSVFGTVYAFFVFLLSPDRAFQTHFLKGIPDLLGHVCQKSIWAFLILFFSHLFSFFWDFIGSRKYRKTNLHHQSFQPYERIVIWQILVLFGAFGISMLGAPTLIVLILIASKTALDLGFHFFANGSDPSPAPV
jgi:Family of unknown function (DUF6498)